MGRVPAFGAVLLVLAACSMTPAATPLPSSDEPSPSDSPSVAGTAQPSATPVATASPMPAAVSWTPIAADGPAAREDHTWTVTGDRSTALLFGGRDGETVFDDLWAFSLADDSWSELPSENGPAARFGHEAVWVDGIGLVVFAGQSGAKFFNDLWAYDPDEGAWRELPSSGAVPTPRYGTCATLGPDGRMWISHGFTADGSRFADTLAYDFAAGEWTDETPGEGARPVERCLHACWWTDDGALTLFAGQTTGVTALGDHWLLRDGSWAVTEGAALPPARNLYAAGRFAGATLVFGGQALDGTSLGDAWWLADGADAIELTNQGEGPPPRSGAAMVVDPRNDRGLLFGGRNAEGSLADVWQLDLSGA